MASVVFPIARGISIGTGMADVKRIEDSVRAGRNAVLTAVAQSTEIHYASILSNAALESAGYTPIPFAARAIGYLAPPVLAFFIKQGIDSPAVRKCALWVQDHLGLLCQLAAAVSSIALVAFGQLALGLTCLALIGIGFLDRFGVLPEFIRLPLHEYSPVVRVVTGLIIGDIFEKIFALFSLAAYGYQRYQSYSAQRVSIHEVHQAPLIAHKEPLTLDRLKIILATEPAFEINPYHLKLDTLAPPPNVEISELRELFKTVSWETELPILKKKFQSDLRFRELHGTIYQVDDVTIIEMLAAQLENYIDSIERRHISAGEIHDYDRLDCYLKTIIGELQKTDDPIKKADALMRLAIDGGSYCGPEKFNVAEDLYVELAMGSKAISPELKILLRLQSARTHWFMSKYNEVVNSLNANESCLTKMMKSVLDFQDLHLYNLFANSHGQAFGLLKSGADNDHVALVDPLTQSLAASVTESLETAFQKEYNRNYVIKELQEAVGTKVLPRLDLFTWWSDWIDKQEISPEEKDALQGELSLGNLLGHRMQSDAYVFKKKFLQAMALDIGILKLRDT